MGGVKPGAKHQQTETSKSAGLVPSPFRRSRSAMCLLPLRGFPGIRGCPNNWKKKGKRFKVLIYKFKGERGG